jgi:hypothetical protein
VRSQPEASAPIVGHLAASATGIIVTGVKQSVGQASWWQIVVEAEAGGTGWVNSRFLAVADPTAKRKMGFGLRSSARSRSGLSKSQRVKQVSRRPKASGGFGRRTRGGTRRAINQGNAS